MLTINFLGSLEAELWHSCRPRPCKVIYEQTFLTDNQTNQEFVLLLIAYQFLICNWNHKEDDLYYY